MKVMLVAVAAALSLSACGETYNSWDDCYAQMTGNGANEAVEHVEHCDGVMKLTHQSAETCTSDHAANKIRADILTNHCKTIH